MEPTKDLSNAHLEHAISLANHAHGMQKDFLGQAYILHPLRVMIAMGHSAPNYVKIAAVLHDIVEDTHIKIEDIENFYGREVKHIVAALTKDPYEAYEIYIREKIMNGPHEARLIKRQDILDNLTRPAPIDKIHGLHKRYIKALSIINNWDHHEAVYVYSPDNIRMQKDAWENRAFNEQLDAMRDELHE